MTLWRVLIDGRVRLAVGDGATAPTHVLDGTDEIDELLATGADLSGVVDLPRSPIGDHTVVTPVGGQEVWASGVTFEESRFAREAESAVPDHYRDVYFAERPELFLKATPGTVRGPGQTIGVRGDSSWDVPEPELALVVNSIGEIVALTLGNDVSSRSIEGANPLYLPQAKVYDESCSVGPCLVPRTDLGELSDLAISMSIQREGQIEFEGSAELAKLKRHPEELVEWLFRARSFPKGVILLTGTGIVPPDSFTLQPGDVVTISASGLGKLTNEVRQSGTGEKL